MGAAESDDVDPREGKNAPSEYSLGLLVPKSVFTAVEGE